MLFRAAAMLFLFVFLLPSIVLAQGGKAAGSRPTVNGAGPIPVTAQSLAKEASALFYDGKFEAALEKFRAANQADPNPTLLFNECRCLKEMPGRQKEATECFKVYIATYPSDNGVGYATTKLLSAPASAPTTAPTRPTATPTSVPASAPTACTLVLRDIPPGSRVTVNGSLVENTSKPITTDCAMQAVVVRQGDVFLRGGRVAPTVPGTPSVWVYEENTPADPALFTVTPDPDAGWGRREWGWTAIGGSAVAAGVASYFTYATFRDFKEAERRNGNHDYTVDQFEDSVSKGERNRTFALVSGGVALVGAGAGVYLLLSGDEKSPHTALAPSPDGLLLMGSF